jgi:hypothetical protein
MGCRKDVVMKFIAQLEVKIKFRIPFFRLVSRRDKTRITRYKVPGKTGGKNNPKGVK